MITEAIASALKILANWTGLRRDREARANTAVEQARKEAQERTNIQDATEATIQKASQGDTTALDDLRRAAGE